MHDGRPGKVVESGSEGVHHEAAFFAVHQPAASPGPVAADGINQYADQYGVSQVHGEFCPFGHGSRYDGGCRGVEYGLENQEAFDGQLCVVETDVEEMGHACKTFGAEHDSKADCPEQEGTQHEVEQVLHQYVCCVFGAGEAGLHQGESRLHKEYQHSCK